MVLLKFCNKKTSLSYMLFKILNSFFSNWFWKFVRLYLKDLVLNKKWDLQHNSEIQKFEKSYALHPLLWQIIITSPVSKTQLIFNKDISFFCSFLIHVKAAACNVSLQTTYPIQFITSNNSLKSDCHLPKKYFFVCVTESPLKMIKNAFYFILKTLFTLKIFKFLSWRFGHIEKTVWLER